MKKLRTAPGTLLASSPDLLDPNFMHTVVLMCQHDDEGAYGLVVNKRADAGVADLLPDHPLLSKSDFPVHWGGPVGFDTLQVLHRMRDVTDGGLELGDGLFLGGDLDEIAQRILAQPRRMAQRVRFLLGYAGWGEGQLDAELATGSWLPAPLSAGLAFEDTQEPTWRRAVRSVGSAARGLEGLPPDPSWN